VDAPPDGPPAPGGPPWKNARFDEETIARALAHLERHRPRFLYLALLDSDERAHRGERAETVEALRRADAAIARIFAWVDALPPDERASTTVIVTTDHGRGDDERWTDHGLDTPAAANIWLAAVGEGVVPAGRAPTTKAIRQADLRPTVERLFGLAPVPCRAVVGCGRVVEEIVGR
jgi:bisphosphoglycerate-independent phosphoglycerate mutase (AlkP superfamily)